ncbi:hypothetical protein HRbin19_00396 [bacterium HR19]|nr:hypothetical protein HRbin19_00396 [bacterium HR19]
MERVFATSRRDIWWAETFGSAVVFLGVILYSIVRALEGKFFEWGPYVSPLYSIPFDTAWISPAVFTMWVPAGYRITCYFCRRVYYRSIFADPPACAVREFKRNYKGESAFPYILLNVHRYFLYLVVIFVFIHWGHAISAFLRWGENGSIKFGMGLGSLLILGDTVLLTLYVLSCHSLRHILGGGSDFYSVEHMGKIKYSLWKFVSRLNEHHGFFFWTSLLSVAIADFYVRAVSSGVINDIRFF